jgi:F-type H+-transporting ATPase subunit gamma
MEMVAASKMRKCVQMTVASRAYAHGIKQIVSEIQNRVDPELHPFLAGVRNSKKALIIIAASDRGLCGGFNGQIIRKAFEFIASRTEHDIQIVTVGKRAELSVRRAGHKIVASFEAISNAPSFERTRALGSYVTNAFIEGKVDRVFILYTDFKSAISQIPTVEQLLPIVHETDLPEIAKRRDDEEEEQAEEPRIYFDEKPKETLNRLLPRLVEMRVYQTMLETSASEHSARMVAMQSATGNATQMMDDLTFTFNQARQASITREISEISAGKAAIE